MQTAAAVDCVHARCSSSLSDQSDPSAADVQMRNDIDADYREFRVPAI